MQCRSAGIRAAALKNNIPNATGRGGNTRQTSDILFGSDHEQIETTQPVGPPVMRVVTLEAADAEGRIFAVFLIGVQCCFAQGNAAGTVTAETEAIGQVLRRNQTVQVMAKSTLVIEIQGGRWLRQKQK